MTLDRQVADKLETLLTDAMLSFAHEHGPLLRSAMELDETANISNLVVMSFLGASLERLYASIGRDASEKVIRSLFDRFETVLSTVEEARKNGVALDPRDVSLSLMGGPST